MILIGTSKIAEYVFNHPKSAPSLLNWIKEHPYRRKPGNPLDRDGKPTQDCSKIDWSPDRGDYQITVHLNFILGVQCITWVGSREEIQRKIELDLEEMRKEGRTITQHTVTTQVVLSPPPPLSLGAKSKTITGDAIMQPSLPAEEVSPYFNPDYISNEPYFKTGVECREALVKIEQMYEAAPGSPEFGKLINLVVRVKEYEENRLEFSVLNMHELVAYRMNMFDLVPSNLTLIAGEEELKQFLAGRASLPSAAIAKLYKFLAIKYPVTDRRFL